MAKAKKIVPPNLDYLMTGQSMKLLPVSFIANQYSLDEKECRDLAKKFGAYKKVGNNNRINYDLFEQEFEVYLTEGENYLSPAERKKVAKPDKMDELLATDRKACRPNRKLVKVESICKKYSISPQRCRSLARDAGAFIEIRRETFVDKEVFDAAYREQFKAERTHTESSSTAPAEKNYMRYPQAADHFSMSLTCFKALAREAGAVRKIGNVALVNIDEVAEYIESNCRQEVKHEET